MNEAQRERELFGLVDNIEASIARGFTRWQDVAFDENGFYDPLPAMLHGNEPPHWNEPPQVETIVTACAMQLRAGSLFAEMLQGKIAGYRVEMDRSEHPTTFHITSWK